MPNEPKAHETKPVLARDGRTTLGFCEVKKYARNAGEPLKEIIIRNADMNCIATILVYKLHSRVHCGNLTEEGQPIDSKLAVEIARVALENAGGPQALLEAIQKEAQRLSLPRTKPNS